MELLDETPLGSVKKENTDPSADDDETYSDCDSIYGPKPTSRTVLARKIKKGNLQSTDARSLPNLRNDEAMYKDQAYHSCENLYEARSNRDIRPESDYEHVSSASEDRVNKRAWSKGELAAKSGSYRAGATQPKKTNSRSPAGSMSSGYRSSHYTVDSDSDNSCHATLASNVALNNVGHDASSATLNDSQQVQGEQAIPDASTKDYSMTNAKIPQRCFKKLIHTLDGKIYDPRDENRQLQNNKQRRLRMAIRRNNHEAFYTSSMEFMRHFVNLFKDQLSEPLNFNQEDLDNAKLEGSLICCDKMTMLHNFRICRFESYEVMPAIWLEWPEYAQEWLDRPRSTWPSDNDINKVKTFGCHLVPEGFLPKKGSNVHQELEWQLVFPAAERYLETCMTHSQAQVYLIALLLHKNFIRPAFDSMYLTTSHIRNKMFWLIEEDDRPSKWPDNRTGECLIKLLNSLYRCLSQNEPTMSDYFIRDKNMFQRKSPNHLLHTQKQLKRIIENPVMYVFHAMESIQHSDRFFPQLDYGRLLKILTMDTLALVNPALDQSMFMSPSTSKSNDMARDEDYNKPDRFWDHAKQQTEKKIYTQVVTNKTLIKPRRATDAIIEISVSFSRDDKIPIDRRFPTIQRDAPLSRAIVKKRARDSFAKTKTREDFPQI